MKNIFGITLAAALVLAISGCETPDETIDNGVEEVENAVGHHEESHSISIVSFGNPNVSGAKEDPAARISGFSMSKSGCSWRNDTDIGDAWGVGKDEIGLIAVVGWQDSNGKFFCAKFDWARPSNRTRDFKNVNDGYNGFPQATFFAAKKHCFFLMKKDGKKRTNIITD